MTMPLLLTRRDVESVLTMKEAIAAVEEGLTRLALGRAIMPQRTAIRMTGHHGLHLGMPAFIEGEGDDPGVLALKVVTVYPDNPAQHSLPTTIGTILLNDPRTGALLAVMDAGFLTAMRTGAASGVATRYLARPDARSCGVFGAGAQARTQLLAVAEVRHLDRAVVCDLQVETRTRFAADMSVRLGIPVTEGDTEACLGCDIVVAATSSTTPIFEGSRLRPGTHVNGIGAHAPAHRELDAEAVRRCTVIADYKPACLAEAGDILMAIREGAITEDHIRASIGDVVAGLKPGRTSAEEITLFKSVGLAVEDVATAALVYKLAIAAGVGKPIEI
jgi:ornithine cyclodeaminase/alanine dehydrogenase